MTEDQIERLVELQVDNLDRAYLRGKVSEAEYGVRMVQIDNWAREELQRGDQ